MIPIVTAYSINYLGRGSNLRLNLGDATKFERNSSLEYYHRTQNG